MKTELIDEIRKFDFVFGNEAHQNAKLSKKKVCARVAETGDFYVFYETVKFSG